MKKQIDLAMFLKGSGGRLSLGMEKRKFGLERGEKARGGFRRQEAYAVEKKTKAN